MPVCIYLCNQVELGTSIRALVQVKDGNNKAIPAKYFTIMKLTAKLGSEIISIR